MISKFLNSRDCLRLLLKVLTTYFTGTFKIRKLDLVREGFNPTLVRDPLFFYNSSLGGYCPLDTCLYEDIISSRCRL